jgi:hypothetical protein
MVIKINLNTQLSCGCSSFIHQRDRAIEHAWSKELLHGVLSSERISRTRNHFSPPVFSQP